MKKRFQKLICLMAFFVLLLMAAPVTVSAYFGEDAMGDAKIDLDKVFLYDSDNQLITNVTDDDLVYFTISEDGEFMQSGVTGETMAYIPVKISDVASINLDDYGLGDYKWESYDLVQKGETEQYYVTLMQMFIYVTENYYTDGWDVEVTGSSGSTYLKNGFWGHDENLTYYVSGEYPLQREGWGATSDHIALEAGDYVDVQMYTDWNFWCTDGAGYRYFVDQTSGEILHTITTDLSNPTTIRLGRAWGNVDVGENTSIVDEEEGYEVYATTEKDPTSDAVWSGVTDEKSVFKITDLAPGSYYLWVHGNLISAPAYAKLQVTCSHTDTEIRDAQEATCVDAGYTGDTYCKGCHAKLAEGSQIPATGSHMQGDPIVTPATLQKAGTIEYRCGVCNTLIKTEPISCPAKFTLSATSYTYDGKVKTPSLKVYDTDNKPISAENYTITYPSGRKNAGTYTCTVRFKGSYSGTKSVSFTIIPGKAVLQKVSVGKKYIMVYAKSKASAWSGAGFQIAYRVNGTSKWTYKTTTAVKQKISGLKKGKKYQVMIRAYKKAGTKTYYGAWSSVKKSVAVK